ncbi:MAG: DUF2799 domain-containing protein [Desulfuromonadales bacterium]|nr:DUF2799 domain-containing protein [Desulfuromonadales bacterium]MBN2791905.1 DUF2799 domain-containing protein [Desulfuromonadales bacterium]
MRLLPAVFLIVLVSALCGCVTLNKNECLYADWQAIGLEDGAKGRDLSYLSRHRKACAKHGVSPDTDLYMSGYEMGLVQFCTPERGFSLGLGGAGYSGICPAELEGDFLSAYQQGYEIYQAERQVKKIAERLHDQENYLADLHLEIKETKAHIISDKTPKKERAKLLKDLDMLKHESEETRRVIHRLKQHKRAAIDYLNMLRYQAGL